MRILIVDSDATSRLLLKSMGTKLGHECEIAGTESRARELLGREQFDVVLTDWGMPGLDGQSLCRMVREMSSENYVQIVFITDLDRPEQILEGMDAGADDYLLKPIDPYTVYARLTAAHNVMALRKENTDYQFKLELANMELRMQALCDDLTGFGNRRAMDEALPRVHANAVRHAGSYGLVLFDIDHFKRYVEDFGELSGDATLRDVSRCLHETLRTGESVYRRSKDEFLLLIPDCDVAALIVAAERARRAVFDAALPHDKAGAEPQITLSAGVSHRDADSLSSSTEVIDHARSALKVAVAAGGNCIQVAED